MRVLMFALVIFGVQWLQVMPVMDLFGPGTEVTCIEIKRMAGFMQAAPAPNFIGFVFCGFMVILAIPLVRMIVVHNRQLAQERLAWQREEELQIMRSKRQVAPTYPGRAIYASFYLIRQLVGKEDECGSSSSILAGLPTSTLGSI